jgi:hypothetical protein
MTEMSRNAFDQLVRDELHDEDLREIARAELAQKVEGLQHALRSARAVIEIRKKHQPTESVVAEARETLDSEREANDLLTKELAESQAREKSLRAALNLLWSWANNWDSEFMNDPDWINQDAEVIQQAAMQSADDTALKVAVQRGIAEFLEHTGQYVTNDASRNAALAAERERCIEAVNNVLLAIGKVYLADECTTAIRALGDEE